MHEKTWTPSSSFRSDNRKSKIQNLKWVGIPAIALTFAFGGAVVTAQQATKVSRIGYLAATSRSTNPARIEAFRQGLRELGYVEGKNIVIEWRFADGKADRLPGFAAELVRLKVDVIVTGGSTATRPAKEAASTIPIVMSQITILLETDSSPALRDPAGISPGWPLLGRS